MTELEYRKKKEEVGVMMKGGKSLYRLGVGIFVVGMIIAFAVYFGIVLMVEQTVEQLNAVTNLTIVIIIATAVFGGFTGGIGVYLKAKAKDMQIELDYWKETRGK
ncbi:MAG: hypothetical protein E3J35_09435 [Methanomassiliicoccales archaeon]|nr:MAG: hypothetical protein E3J35_09435 [Methanomassiliicoccales archaeon]